MELLIKTQKANENFADNHGHDILRLLRFYHKGNEEWFLVLNLVYTSCFTSCRTTYNLRLSVVYHFTWKLHFFRNNQKFKQSLIC